MCSLIGHFLCFVIQLDCKLLQVRHPIRALTLGLREATCDEAKPDSWLLSDHGSAFHLVPICIVMCTDGFPMDLNTCGAATPLPWGEGAPSERGPELSIYQLASSLSRHVVC